MTSSSTQPSQDQSNPSQGKRIIVRNLPVGITREELRELGDRYGRVISVDLVPKGDSPFGFISFLSEDDALFSVYRLSGYIYKGSKPLKVSLSNAKPVVNVKPGSNRAAAGPKEDVKPAKPKKPLYSLRTLTPHNPPTPSPLQQQPQSQNTAQKSAWDNAVTQSAPAVINNNAPNNGYDQPTGKNNKNRKNNYNNNRGKGNRNYKPAGQQKEHSTEEVIDNNTQHTESAPVVLQSPDNVNQITVTEVQIMIENNQWLIKLGPEQLDEFLKVVEPYLQQNHEIH
jgi:RNA recognition motif-containing protein